MLLYGLSLATILVYASARHEIDLAYRRAVARAILEKALQLKQAAHL